MSRDTSRSLAAASPNFGFLSGYESRLLQSALSAERYVFEDPVVALMRLRQFGELLAQEAAALVGIYADPHENQVDLLRRLSDRGVINPEVAGLFHDLRRKGNEAAHQGAGDRGASPGRGKGVGGPPGRSTDRGPEDAALRSGSHRGPGTDRRGARPARPGRGCHPQAYRHAAEGRGVGGGHRGHPV